MKSSAPDEHQTSLGKPIRPEPQQAGPKVEKVNASGTIVTVNGKMETRMPTPEPKRTWAPYVPPGVATTTDLEAYFEAINQALVLRLGDTDFPIDEYGV